eukprot:360637-Chlamydomonas_euryale.AAC.7
MTGRGACGFAVLVAAWGGTASNIVERGAVTASDLTASFHAAMACSIHDQAVAQATAQVRSVVPWQRGLCQQSQHTHAPGRERELRPRLRRAAATACRARCAVGVAAVAGRAASECGRVELSALLLRASARGATLHPDAFPDGIRVALSAAQAPSKRSLGSPRTREIEPGVVRSSAAGPCPREEAVVWVRRWPSTSPLLLQGQLKGHRFGFLSPAAWLAGGRNNEWTLERSAQSSRRFPSLLPATHPCPEAPAAAPAASRNPPSHRDIPARRLAAASAVAAASGVGTLPGWRASQLQGGRAGSAGGRDGPVRPGSGTWQGQLRLRSAGHQ